jgi:hypothetical protein
MLGGARPVAIGPRACDGAAHVASTCGEVIVRSQSALGLQGDRRHALPLSASQQQEADLNAARPLATAATDKLFVD